MLEKSGFSIACPGSACPGKPVLIRVVGHPGILHVKSYDMR